MEFLNVNTLPFSCYLRSVPATASLTDFAQRLAILRKQKGLTQQQLADRIQTHVQQLKRYEAGSSQPTLDVIRKLAMALGVTSDQLLFGKDEPVPIMNCACSLKPSAASIRRKNKSSAACSKA